MLWSNPDDTDLAAAALVRLSACSLAHAASPLLLQYFAHSREARGQGFAPHGTRHCEHPHSAQTGALTKPSA